MLGRVAAGEVCAFGDRRLPCRAPVPVRCQGGAPASCAGTAEPVSIFQILGAAGHFHLCWIVHPSTQSPTAALGQMGWSNAYGSTGMPGIAPPKSRRLAPPASIGACADVGVPDANLYGRAAHPAPPGAPRIAPRNRGSDTDTSTTSSVYSPPACAGVSETPGRSCILDTSVPSLPRSAPPRRLVSHQPRASILTGILAHPSTKGAHLSHCRFSPALTACFCSLFRRLEPCAVRFPFPLF